MILALAENSIQLVPDGTLLLHVVVIVLMVSILNRTLYRPINQILSEREIQTKGRLSEAAKVGAVIAEESSRYERALREARATGYHLVESEREQALRVREEDLSILKDDVRSLVSQEVSEIQAQADQARPVIKQESRKRAEQIGSRLLGRPITGA